MDKTLRMLAGAIWLATAPMLQAAPANDNCLGAIALTNGVPFSMSTVGATATGDPSLTCGGSSGRTVWFSFTPSASGAASIRLCGSSFDTVLGVFTGGCDGLELIPNGCVDDSAECGLQSAINFQAIWGVTYFILAGGVSGVGGNLTVVAEVAGVKITNQPTGGTIEAGETFTFSVQAVGSPLFYQWRLEGEDIPGANNSWFTLPNLTPSSQGSYSVVVSDFSMSVTSDVANLTITPGLGTATDTPALTWRTGGGLEGWFRQTDFWHDGLDAARCGAGGGTEGPWMETVINGPATLSFWWYFPSPTENTDYLSLAVNGQARIFLVSLDEEWVQEIVYLGSGSQTCRWAYVEGDFPGGGPGYIDQVVIFSGGTAPHITSHPEPTAVMAGSDILLNVDAFGTPPLTYQWFYKDQLIEGADASFLHITNALPSDDGTYYAVVQSPFGSPATSLQAEIEVVTLPLDGALDYRGLPLHSPGSAWFGQVGTTYDGLDALRSPELSHNQASKIYFEAAGPGTISFWWKVSSEANYDALRFRTDSVLQSQISGEVDWTYQSFTIPAGKHRLEWSYEKDKSLSRGQDAAWLDQLVFDGPPFLVCEPAGSDELEISWPWYLESYTLQSTPSLSGNQWSNVPTAPMRLGERLAVFESLTNGARFYRLVK